ncbi:hypothetical protein DB30_01746 [Enhygromyxa salina]|uniref:Phage tail collar domain-containing protein n=1 Tax=Enhygromyxa salina TaxID=215803 RepID=A0A0C2CRK3_9BACT|nr:tail fiber protein [Enhygromyxa salina]KIG12270.1 hypothetical protein DB30_01746 [Enhygromyxa salina]
MLRDLIPGLTLGMGADPVLGQLRGDAIDHAGVVTSGGEGQTVEFELEVVTNVRELSNALDVSAAGTYSGVFSASARAKYVTSSNFNSYHTYVIVKCHVTNPIQVLADVRPKPSVNAWVKTAKRAEFHERFGTEFLVGEVSGGAYYGVIDIASTTSDKQREIAAQVSGSGWGASADASVAQRMRAVSENLSKRIEVFREGGEGSNPTDIDQMIQAVVNFPEQVRARSVVFRGIYKDYKTVMFENFERDPSPEETTQRHNDIELLGRMYLDMIQLRGDLTYMMTNLGRLEVGEGVKLEGFDSIDDPTLPHRRAVLRNNLERAWKAVTTLVEQIPDVARKCRSGDPYTVPTPYSLDFQLPNLIGENMQIKQMSDKIAELQRQVVPLGTIAMWSGSTIPNGWALCNGEKVGIHQTPDLRGRFVVGYDPGHDEYKRVGNLSQGGNSAGFGGGVDTIEHTHVVAGHSHSKGDLHVAGGGAHNHRIQGDGDGNSTYRPKGRETSNVHRSYRTETDGDHGHSNASFGGRVGRLPASPAEQVVDGDRDVTLVAKHDNRPKFYVLAYIVKVA